VKKKESFSFTYYLLVWGDFKTPYFPLDCFINIWLGDENMLKTKNNSKICGTIASLIIKEIISFFALTALMSRKIAPNLLDYFFI